MPKSTFRLSDLLNALTTSGRVARWSDAEWARCSGLPKETLCRLRSPSTCVFATLDALARSLDATLAVTLASVPSLDRRTYLDLAEALHPGATVPRVFARWLAETPLPPSRFLPMLEAGLDRAA